MDSRLFLVLSKVLTEYKNTIVLLPVFMNTIGFYIVYSILWLMAWLPLPVLYLKSDFLYILVYHIFKYRRNVVRVNLKKSFPDKNFKDIIAIEKDFYHHFCDSFVEWIYPLHASANNIKKRMQIENPEVLNDLYDKNKSVVVVLGHYANWEWLSVLPTLIKHKIWAIHKPLSNKFFDGFINHLRSKFGVHMVDMRNTFRTLHSEQLKSEKVLTYFLADQSPAKDRLKYYTNFLNQDTPVYLGAEQIAKKLNMAVVFFDIQKVKRGYYKIHCELLSENPSDTAEFEITESHTRELERIIRKEPYPWLWSHRRWKHSRY